MTQAPGSYVTISAAPPAPLGNPATGTWFVTGQTAQGPTGVAIPITSMSDYAAYLGTRVSYGFLYDSLNEFFSDGGVIAYVSRLVGPSAATATITAPDHAAVNTLTFNAVGAGAWGNNLSVVVAAGTAANSYTLAVKNSTTTVLTSPNLFAPADAVNYFASLNSWSRLITVVNEGSSTAAPNNNPAVGTYALTGGADDTADVTETQWTNALTAFTDQYGVGQVSAPGHTSAAGYVALATHAQTYERVALLDVADSSSAATLTAQASTFQGAATDPSYAAMFAPWIVIPGLTSVNPGSSSPVPVRTIPPSALAAALMARNDQTNDSNTAAAGPNGGSNYAVNVTQTYSEANRLTLNNAGIDVIRLMTGTVTLYGYRSLATDPNWTSLSNVRFRMQVSNDFDAIGENFVFAEIDGKGQIFARLNGALAGRCQQYWINGSIYGLTAESAFSVNTGPQVNTPITIAAGAIQAIVLMRMSPTAELVEIQVVKYLASANLPA